MEQRRASILASIGAIGDSRPGSVSEFFTKCGRLAGHCQQEDDPSQRPYVGLVVNSAGGRTCRSISSHQADVPSAEISEQLSDARLRSTGQASARAVELRFNDDFSDHGGPAPAGRRPATLAVATRPSKPPCAR